MHLRPFIANANILFGSYRSIRKYLRCFNPNDITLFHHSSDEKFPRDRNNYSTIRIGTDCDLRYALNSIFPRSYD